MQENIRNERWASGEKYDSYIQAELSSFRRNAWKEVIGRHLSRPEGMEILDVGTGPGFLAVILSEMGHSVTAIDSSDGMLEKARANAQKAGVSPHFIKMDISELSFEDGSFDIIVLRNVSWTLEYPEKVYSEFNRMLRPGGKLLIYDANWNMHYYDEGLMEKVKRREWAYYEKYGRVEEVSGEDRAYVDTCPLARIMRPEWDRKKLGQMGFAVSVTEDMGRVVYEEWEKELYAESPLFEICASKPSAEAVKHNMHSYWNERAFNFGFAKNDYELEIIAEKIGRYLPQGQLRILDVGTGTGVMACSVAAMGHRVSASDLCENMLEQAGRNAGERHLDIDFTCAPADALPYADESFDVVISRNLTWALPEPDKALREWKRVLKHGGILIYMDGNHYRYYTDPETAENRRLFGVLTGSVHSDHNTGDDYDYSLCDDTAKDLPLSPLNRPAEWDDMILPQMGFDILSQEIENPQHLLKHGVAAGYYSRFMIVALAR